MAEAIGMQDRRRKQASLALVLGAASFMCCFFTAIPAAILAIGAKDRKLSPGVHDPQANKINLALLLAGTGTASLTFLFVMAAIFGESDSSKVSTSANESPSSTTLLPTTETTSTSTVPVTTQTLPMTTAPMTTLVQAPPPSTALSPVGTEAPRITGELRRSDFGDKWPLTVESGVVSCERGSAVIFRSGGKTYAVNGIAMGMAGSNGWHDLRQIWGDDPTFEGMKIDISPVLEAGLDQC